MGPIEGKKVFTGDCRWGTLCSVVRYARARKGVCGCVLARFPEQLFGLARVPWKIEKPALGGLLCGSEVC